MTLRVVTGPPCAGKTTHVQSHRRDGELVVDLDALAEALGAKTGHQATGEVKRAALAARRAAIEHAIGSGASAWVIHSQPTTEDRERYARQGADFVDLDPGLDEVLSRAKWRPEGTDAAIRRWYANQHTASEVPKTAPSQEGDHTMSDTADKSQTPPWGDDFDAEKAWTLVQNLRGEVKAEKDKRTAAETARDDVQRQLTAIEDQGKTDAQRATDQATKTAEDLAAARRELYIERALRKHNVPEDYVEFLTGDDEDSILAKAEKLASLGKPAQDDDSDDGANEQPPADGSAPASGRPQPGLQPGHGGNDPEPVDIDALVASIR